MNKYLRLVSNNIIDVVLESRVRRFFFNKSDLLSNIVNEIY